MFTISRNELRRGRDQSGPYEGVVIPLDTILCSQQPLLRTHA